LPDFIYSDFLLEELGGTAPKQVRARFLDMIRYLKGVAPEGRLPGRQHIDPVDFWHVIRLVNLVDVERSSDGVQFRFRLVGEEQTRLGRRDVTGRLVEDAVIPELAPRIIANMNKVLATGSAVYDSFPMPHPNRQFIPSQRMYYPLAKDGGVIDKILILNDYEKESGP
jgi:hypothetical protein